MKTYLKQLSVKINFWNLFIGIVIGFAVGIYVFSMLVPSGVDMIKLYHLESYKEFREHQNK